MLIENLDFGRTAKEIIMKRFENQVALITGGARGIGAAIGQRLAEEGAKVYLLDLLEGELDKTVSRLRTAGLAVSGLVFDITQEQDVEKAIKTIVNLEDRLDILINSAGIVGQTSIKIVDYDLASFQKVLSVNLVGAFLTTKYVLPCMIKQQYGRILHITSIGGKDGNPGMVGYVASKSGVIGLVKGVGKEYAETGITVNGLAPAVIATEMNNETAPEMLDYMRSKIPMGRLGTVEEVASIASWIVSEEASFNTGFIFDLSGGRATS